MFATPEFDPGICSSNSGVGAKAPTMLIGPPPACGLKIAATGKVLMIVSRRLSKSVAIGYI